MKLFWIFFTLFTFCSVCKSQDSNNLIYNGDFEAGNKGFASGYEFNENAVMPGTYSVVTNGASLNVSFAELGDHTTGKGKYLIVDVDGNEPTRPIYSVKAKAPLKAELELSLYAANINIQFRNPPYVQLLVNGRPLGEPEPLPDNTNAWNLLQWKFTAGNSDSIVINLHNENNNADGSDLALDDIVLKVLSAPEQPKPIVVTDNCPHAGDTIKNLVHFPFNESALTAYSKEKLEKMVAVLKECPAIKLTIIGHTDMYGGNAYNDKLSLARAKAVAEYLMGKGIDSARLSTKPEGERELLYIGTSVKENVKNRRVYFVIGR